MGLLNFLAPRRQMPAIEARSAIAWDTLFKRGLESLMVQNEATDPYSQVDTVYVAISTIASSVGSTDFGLWSGDTELESHPLEMVLDRPDRRVPGLNLWRGTCVHLETCGRAFWYLAEWARPVGGGPRVPNLIQLLPPGKVKPHRNQGGELDGWIYTTSTGVRTLSLEEVERFAYFDPRDELGGLAPLEAARLGYSLAWKSTKWQEGFFANGAVPPFYIKFPAGAGPKTQEQADSFSARFAQKWLGMRNAARPPLMVDGAELASVAINQRDSEWISTQKLTREQILAVFGVPPAVAGVYEDANRSNSEVQRRLFWHSTIIPKLELIASVINSSLMQKVDPSVEFRWEIKARLAEAIPEDVRASISSAQALMNMGVPPSEAFRVLGLEVDTSGCPWLDIGWLPFNLVPAEQLLNPPEPAPAPAPAPAADDTQDEDGPEDAPPAKSLRRQSLPSTARDSVWRGFNQKLSAIERQYVGDYRKFLTWLQTQTLKRLSGKKSVERGDTGGLLPPDDEIRVQAVARITPSARRAIEQGWEDLIAEVGMNLTFDWLDPRVLALLRERQQSIRGASDTIATRLRDRLSDALDQGASQSELRQIMLETIGEAYTGQAWTVARTETAAGMNGARYAAMQSAGITKQEWLSARDDRARDSHADLDGEVVLLGQPFSNGLEYPLDPGGPPEEVINCRCTALAVVDGSDE